jgi:hypothetical protein
MATKARNLADLLADGAVGTSEIADSAVTTDKVADSAVTAAKMAGGAAVGNLGYTPMDQQALNINFRNRIINGDMRIDQRNNGGVVTASNSYTLDRWLAIQTNEFSVQRNAGAVTPPVGFTNYLGVVSLAATTPAAGAFYQVKQHLEGFNVADFAWGTASAKDLTLSFWVRSSLTGNFGVIISWGGSNAIERSYPILYSISSANTWEYKTITIPGDTTMAASGFATTNNTGIQLRFSLGGGATNAGTSGAWATGNLQSVTGDTSVVSTNAATFYITGVQLEAGSVATPFERRPFGTELALCQRYFSRVNAMSGIQNPSSFGSAVSYPVEMRASPTFSLSAALKITDAVAADFTQSSASVSIVIGTRVTNLGAQLTFPNFSGTTNYRPAFTIPNETGVLLISAEL